MQPEAERPPGGPPWPGARGSGSGAPANGLSRSKRLYVRAQSVDRVIHSGGDPDQHVQILAHVAHLPDDAVELTRSRDALVVLNQPLRYVAPLRRMQGIIFRGADKLPEWRSRLDQPLVEGRGGGIARLACPSSRWGPGHPLSAQTPDLQTPRSHQETWADCLTRTFAPTWTRS